MTIFNLTLEWQYPYSVQHSAYEGQPPVQYTVSALYGAAAQLPCPDPAPSRPARQSEWERSDKETFNVTN